MDRQEQVCVVRALECYIDLTADPDMFLHQDPVYPFLHVFMSQVVDNHIGPRKGKFFHIGPSTCSRWLRTIMDRVEIPKEHQGGSVRMAAESAAIDRGMPIDVVLSIGRWASWQVFQQFLQPVSTHSRGSSSRPYFAGLTGLSNLNVLCVLCCS